MEPGHVSFVGLGPGDGTLLTARAVDRLAKADAVLREGQAGIHEAIALARQGRRVVRAVRFDALESPRVVDEVRAVAKAGVSVEVVPGVGAASAAAAFAGAMGRATHVAVEGVEAALALEPPGAAVTMIAGVASPTQRVVETTVREAPARALGLAAAGAPDASLLLVLGAPDPALRWFERLPLFGKRVLVTRAVEQAGSTAALLRERGAEPVVVPTIALHPPGDSGPLVRALGDLRRGMYGWVAFTSANGVERMWDALVACGADARAFGGAKLAAIGPATASALDRRGLRADVVAKEFRGEGLADEMLAAIHAGPAAPRVLLARAAKARDVLPDALRGAGCQVDVVAAYETRSPSPETVGALASALERGDLDAATFTSSSTVENFCDLLGSSAPALLERVRVASIGPITTETARQRGLRVDVTAREYTVWGLVRALADSYG